MIALLEDLRPKRMNLSPDKEKPDKEKRGDRYVHLPAFEWVLQRLAEPNYAQPGDAPHFVVFDLCAISASSPSTTPPAIRPDAT